MQVRLNAGFPLKQGSASRVLRLRTLLKRNRVVRAVHTLVGPQNCRRLRRHLLTVSGYNQEQWARVVYYADWKDLLRSLPAHSASALEVSPGSNTIWRDVGFRSYSAVQYPEFDICFATLAESFDVIIADQVFEHLRHPYQAARNVRAMLRPGGIFLIATPFLIKVHGVPGDFTRWTVEGLRAFLEDCGFSANVHAWGNRKAVNANFKKWCAYGWKRDLRDEADFPVVIWGDARTA